MVNDTIALYFETGTSDLSGIEVRRLQTIDVGSIRARLEEKLSNHLHLLEQDLTLRTPITNQLAQLGVLDMETRKVDFFLSEFTLVSERFAFLWKTFQGKRVVLSARIAFSAG